MAHSAIAVEGGLFPTHILDRIVTGDMPGQGPKDFDQPDARRLTDRPLMQDAAVERLAVNPFRAAGRWARPRLEKTLGPDAAARRRLVAAPSILESASPPALQGPRNAPPLPAARSQ